MTAPARPRRCAGCGARLPSGYHRTAYCRDCLAARRALAASSARLSGPLRGLVESRIALYQARAAAGLPLFFERRP